MPPDDNAAVRLQKLLRIAEAERDRARSERDSVQAESQRALEVVTGISPTFSEVWSACGSLSSSSVPAARVILRRIVALEGENHRLRGELLELIRERSESSRSK